MSTSSRLIDRNFVLLVTAHFISCLGWTSMLLLPVYLEHLGASRTQIGSVMAAAAISSLLLRPLTGWALDHLGRRVTLVAGTLFGACGMALVGLVHEVGVLAYVMRLVFGIGQGVIFTGYFVWLTDLVPQARRTEGIALFGVSGLAPLSINAFADQLGVVGPELRWFLPLLGAVMLLALFALYAVPETVRRRRAAEQPDAAADLSVDDSPSLPTPTLPPPQVLRMLVAPPMLSVWLATVVLATLAAVFFSFVTVSAESRGVARAATVWLAYAGGAIVVRVLGGRLPDRLGTSNLVAPALGAYAAATLLAARVRSSGALYLAGALAGLGHGYGFPVLTSQLMSRADERRRGAAMAMFTALWETSRLVLTPLFGAVADAHGDATMFSLVASCAAGGLLAWLVAERWQLRSARAKVP